MSQHRLNLSSALRSPSRVFPNLRLMFPFLIGANGMSLRGAAGGFSGGCALACKAAGKRRRSYPIFGTDKRFLQQNSDILAVTQKRKTNVFCFIYILQDFGSKFSPICCPPSSNAKNLRLPPAASYLLLLLPPPLRLHFHRHRSFCAVPWQNTILNHDQ